MMTTLRSAGPIVRVSAVLLGSIPGLVYAAGGSSNATIVTVYEGMAQYADAMHADPSADRRVLWQKHVVEPYWRRCAEGGDYIDFAPPLATPYEDFKSLRTAASALQASQVRSLAQAAVDKSAAILSSDATTVCILAADSTWTYLRGMHGVGGFTAGAGKIWLTILPEGDWADWVAYATAHEYHHSVWTARHGRQHPIEELTDYLVFEGRADSFAQVVYPRPDIPWTNALTPPQERAAWEVIRPNLNSQSTEMMQALMFGGVKGVPRWAGYTIGFNLVQSYLKTHAARNVNDWTAIDANALLTGSAYSPQGSRD